VIGQLAFAFLAGSVATVNPCGFALLPAYLARRLTIEMDGRSPSAGIGHALAAGSVMTVGFLLIFGIGGGAIALGAGWLTVVFPWVGLVIGVVLAGVGLVVLSGRHVGLNLLPQPAAATGGLRGDLVFGLGYGTVSLSCTLPIFLAVMGAATTDGALVGALSVSAYALGMGTVVVTLALGAALSRNGIAFACRSLLPYVTRVSGALLVLAGLYVAYFWGYTLFSPVLPTGGGGIAAGVRLAGSLRGWVGVAAGQLMLYSLLVALSVVTVWVFWRRAIRKSRYRGVGTDANSFPKAN